MVRKKEEINKAVPLFSRIYIDHKIMILSLIDEGKFESSAEIVRRGIEKVFEDNEKQKSSKSP